MPIHYENWDAPTHPALPSGWNPSTAGAIVTSTATGSVTPISSPNMLAFGTATNNTPYLLTWSTLDGNGGDVTVQGTGNFGPPSFVANGFFSVVARGNSATLNYASSTFYEVQLTGAASNLVLNKVVAGTRTQLAALSLLVAGSHWYQIALTAAGSSLSVTVQRLSDSYWLNNSGAFQSASTTAIVTTDSSISGAGYAGWGFQSDDTSLNLINGDDWTLAAYSVSPILSASAGVFTLTGKSASLLHARTLAAGTGAFTLTGESANLTQNVATLAAAPGSFVLTGEAASLLHARKVPANPGTFLLTGDSATLIAGLTLATAPGTFLLTGEPATLELGGMLMATAGAFALTGDPAVLYAGDFLNAATGVYTVGRIPATLTDLHLLPAAPGSFVLTGVPAIVEQPYELPVSAGVFNLTGQPAGIWQEQTLSASCGSYILTGLTTVLTIGVPGGGPGPISYTIYASPTSGAPIDYDTPVGSTSLLTWTSGVLAYPGVWRFGVRASDAYGQEKNLEAAVTIVLSAGGTDVSNLPGPPIGLRAFSTAGGGIRVEWGFAGALGPRAPTVFHVYKGIGSPSYGSPAVTVSFASSIQGSFVANLTGLVNGTTYTIGVRAANATAEESNTSTVTAASDSTGPAAVDSLTATATI